jgi:hypothetical protein
LYGIQYIGGTCGRCIRDLGIELKNKYLQLEVENNSTPSKDVEQNVINPPITPVNKGKGTTYPINKKKS